MRGAREIETGRIIAALAAAGPLRVWSVIVTIFGDSVLPRGGVAGAAALGAIAARLGIRPSALRVALHRLVRDGWALRAREGRGSLYRLSPEALARSAEARRRIYAPGPALTGPWRLAAAPAGLRERPEGFALLAPGLWLGGAGQPVPEGALALDGAVTALPDWARAALGPPELAADYARLAAALEEAAAMPGEPAPLDALALRTLVIHQWRRLLLRHADLPAGFFPDGWQGEACRARVLALHARLSPAAEHWLDAHIPA